MDRGALLCVFARAPVAGRVKTRLIPRVGAAGAAALQRAFLDDVCRLGRGVAGRRVLAVDGEVDHPELVGLAAREGMAIAPQVGSDLGARMAAAIARGLAEGAERVLVIGSDSPLLPPAWLERALAVVVEGGAEVVLGPAEDGGFWTIGARCPVGEGLAGVAWGGPTALVETEARLAATGLRVARCDRFWDVDEPADLDRLGRALDEDPDPERAPATRRALAGE